jgi:hypothetical protein
MAKVAFTKLGLKLDKEVKTINWNDQEIEIKQYLPANEKLDMISRIINMSADDMKFYNVGKLEIFMTLELIYEYSNINFTDKQKEDVCKLYDMLVSSGLCKAIMGIIPNEEIEWIDNVLMNTINSIYSYQNSAIGILDSITQDYTNLDLEASTIQQKLADPENLELLKGIMTRLG